ncbi:hypothetical protein H6P81_015083 [Aristolochia fimbriata]|uniref:Uncharacterized protein n=1 Tax=Aristolochia fimbriata TaxID=158543 RepID=A0AAV7E557_ARIFI|nr:hypothetical protein H6P81_015083 [Aristolochia fimbriata]
MKWKEGQGRDTVTLKDGETVKSRKKGRYIIRVLHQVGNERPESHVVAVQMSEVGPIKCQGKSSGQVWRGSKAGIPDNFAWNPEPGFRKGISKGVDRCRGFKSQLLAASLRSFPTQSRIYPL